MSAPGPNPELFSYDGFKYASNTNREYGLECNYGSRYGLNTLESMVGNTNWIDMVLNTVLNAVNNRVRVGQGRFVAGFGEGVGQGRQFRIPTRILTRSPTHIATRTWRFLGSYKWGYK